MTNVLLADDHPVLRKGIRDIIEEENNFKVIAESSDGEDTLSLIRKHTPDIAVLDVNMPKLNGLDVVAEINRQELKTKIVILTMDDNENIFKRAMDLGVYGYLLKDNAVIEIVEAIKKVADGKYYITPSLSSHMVNRCNENNKYSEEQLPLSLLTAAERKILKRVAEGRSSQDIANELYISLRTVDTHRNNICRKLKLHGPNSLFKYAMEHKNLLLA